ncbi:YkvI family membrane protein [Corynebacterium phocae]|uniref:YkvI family membrane protein n=1 Tax=Corynebacterium phocae TaxID=161895 RepID=UPI0009533F37|nr:hypothetical protein [Corynebacterium phocae]KAA8723040.1 hypothetical protein F4V58_06825 [Corynebacterium phocae]
MSVGKTVSIALSFIGLLVGAGFATGREVVQYFTSFGLSGIWGIILAGTIMTLAGTVFLQLGSYFQANAHNDVFQRVAHPWISRFLDLAVILTLFAIGVVMLAGAGSNLAQQFGTANWVGSTIMLVLVLVAGMLDVGKVSKVISGITPLIVVAVVGLGVHTAFNLPEDIGLAMNTAAQTPSPIDHWLLSALNYSGLALILALSMSLVIGGDNSNPKEAGRGGLLGGFAYAVLMATAAFALVMNAEVAANDDIPLLTLVNQINGTLGLVMAVTIYLMIFNTAIGMFYALGKRLSAGREARYRVIFVATTLVGFACSFFGFKSLMAVVYPILGYLGIVTVVVMVYAWFKGWSDIKDESVRRARVRELLGMKMDPEQDYNPKYDQEIGQHVADSNVADQRIYDNLKSEAQDAVSGEPADVGSVEDYQPEEGSR